MNIRSAIAHITACQWMIDNFDAAYKSLSRQFSESRNALQKLEAVSSSFKAKNADLEARNAELESSNNYLQTMLSGLKESYSYVQARCTDLEAENHKLQAQCIEYPDERVPEFGKSATKEPGSVNKSTSS